MQRAVAPAAASAREWITLGDQPVPLEAITGWVVEPSCGGVVTFLGTVRDHAEGRPGVSRLEYEAYEEVAVAELAKVAAEARRRWPSLGRVALHHRVGPLEPCEVAVAVAVAAPHRAEAFEAARFCIDTLKSTVPIWKFETWQGGAEWSEATAPLVAGGDGPGGQAAGAGSAGGHRGEREVRA